MVRNIVTKDGGLSTNFRSLLTTFALLSTGCAAPMTEVVAKRQSETIDHQLFKDGDQVWVTYQDKDTIRTKSGHVLDMDGDSVRLDTGRKGVVDLEYRRIHTLRHPRNDEWFYGLSSGARFIGTCPPKRVQVMC